MLKCLFGMNPFGQEEYCCIISRGGLILRPFSLFLLFLVNYFVHMALLS